MRSAFSKCLTVILRYEGGYTNHPRDPGGVTLEGVIQRVYDGYRTRKRLPRRALTPTLRGTPEWIAERDEIYRLQYWNAVRGDELPAGVDLFLFDSAVNSGPYQAIKWLQRGLAAAGVYHGPIDGHLGEGTMAAAHAHPDHDALIADMAARRLGMLQQLSTWTSFGGGWAQRVASAKSIGQAWASGSVGPEPVEVDRHGGGAKAYASDVAQPAVDAGNSVKGGLGGATTAALIDGAKDKLAPLVGTSDLIDHVFTALTLLSVVVGIGALLYALWSAHKTRIAQRAVDGDLVAEVPEGQPA
ncbi:glycoside hydrolase family 108 protein [Rhodopseudomonas palustris]|uniref:glycoside hydrolase family 108 protein n=1 Tax=Rhodopseudomonas palustris TaxID=1076 RepID=UPI0016023E4E|nr:glycoside hydrolase family 108 protein [Rhodopseudomonas palustris]